MYAFAENEKLDEKLSFVRDSFLEKPTEYADIEVRRVNILGEKHQISLVAWRR